MVFNESGSKVDFLYLSEEELIQLGVLDTKKCVEVMEDVFKLVGEGDYIMGGPDENEHGIKIWFPREKRTDKMPSEGPDRRFMSMISYLGGKYQICGDKWYGSNRNNMEKGLPRPIITITLNNVETGQPIALMSGNLISNIRTGSIPGVAAKYLAPSNSNVLSVIGAGVINWCSVLGILETQKQIKKVKIFDLSNEAALKFSDRLKKQFNISTIVTESMEECINGSDIVTVATSGKVQPEIEDRWIKDGCLLTFTGGVRLPDEFLAENKIVLDNWKMHKNTAKDWVEWERNQGGSKKLDKDTYYGIGGQVYRLVEEKLINESDILNLGNIVLGNVKGRRNDKEKIIFYAGGMAVEDLAWGYTLYKEAIKRNIGQSLKLWDQPHKL